MLADADPHGLHISLVYIAALPDQTTFKIGIRPCDREGVLAGLSDEVLLPLEQRDIALANNLIQVLAARKEGGKAAVYQDIQQQLQFLLLTGKKFEVEALASLDENECFLIEYMKLNFGGTLDHQALSAL